MIWLLSSLGGVSIIAVLAVGFLVGWPLILNKYVLGGLALVLLFIGAGIAWESAKNKYREEGKQAIIALNVAAQAKRNEDKRMYDQDLSDEKKEALDRLALSKANIDTKRTAREGNSHVTTKTDSITVITRGFVRDYDASITFGHAAVPIPKQADDDTPSGIPASAISRAIGRNNDICAGFIAELDSIEELRYAACIAWDKRFGTQSGCVK